MTTDPHVRIQGLPVSAIAEEFGTPFFVYDADTVRADYTRLRDGLRPSVDIYYSLKANPNVSVSACLRALGAGAEVSSETELITALRAGFAPEDIIFLGPGKTPRELAACVRAGIRAVVCESLGELRLLDGIAARSARGGPLPVMLRINPSFPSHGSGLAMGGRPRQFGIDAELLRGSRAELRALRHLRVEGIHAYVGTRFLDPEDVTQNTRGILAEAAGLAEALHLPLRTVDFGGGIGVAYFDNEKDPDVGRLVDGINEAVDEFARGHPDCRYILEAGRYLTAASGTYVVRVLDVKESMGEAFAVTDGGTNHHMAAVGVGSFVRRNFPLRSLDRQGEPAAGQYTVTGPLCTPTDVLGRKVALPAVRPGDLLGVGRSGAYGPSASPGRFLSHGYPAEVLVHEGRAHLVRRRDTPDDLLSPQRLVEV
ncbi:alanine racemase [Streptomyces spectabilis]|uniref:Diaminopimelate decarboxylase n=1 Tax=Streptomyces spectabilis TaxID=68270 RepID=A0A5P2WXJ7_STRST|nr:alanine racemase [Streptomyces spectabilis]MBB5108895.1 diaminopimelate decarboxylase [Streptomyces spectabilis]MCI3899811.1 alanine racemase [Streptomyces spectabilis]QEV57473.1 diaminopimelate decarboxylase [Streptomyces spectabilis]GGV42773.1 diaminopimelate decarboxylase [Streptomyces spectabilis]